MGSTISSWEEEPLLTIAVVEEEGKSSLFALFT